MREVCRPGGCFTFFFLSWQFVQACNSGKEDLPSRLQAPSSSSILCHDTKDQDREGRVGGGDGGGGGVGVDVSADEWDVEAAETIFWSPETLFGQHSTPLPSPQRRNPKACLPHEASWKVPLSFRRFSAA